MTTNRLRRFWLMVAAFAVLHGTAVWAQEAMPSDEAPTQPVASLGEGLLEGTVAPGSYVVGAGDMLEIGFWGEVNRSQTVVVNPDGDMLVPPVGPIHVDGLMLSEVRDLVRTELAPYYKPDIMSISLVSIRSFQVHVVGLVEEPGAYPVNAVTRVSQAVQLAGGLRSGASRRSITLIRGQKTMRVDLSRYLLMGDNSMNPYLRGGDVIHVPPVAERVYVYGSVYLPGSYDFVQGENLGDLIALAGGLRPEADPETIEIQRFDRADPASSEAIFVKAGQAAFETIELEIGDRVFVRAVPDWHKDAKVELVGEVTYPGVYVIEEGVDRLTDVVMRAGGLSAEASLAEARLIRGAYAARGLRVEAELAVARELQNGNQEKDIDLLKTMSREVKGNVSISFEELFLHDEGGPDILLRDGDVIDIPEASRMVRVAGHVRHPGLVTYKPDEGHMYYIEQAGGFAPGANRWGTRLVSSIGGQRIKPGSQPVRPGDIVWVPRQVDRNWWSITKEVIQVLAQIATIYVVADEVSKR